MEHEIPSVWAVAKNRNSKGVNLICAAGANPDPVRAVKSRDIGVSPTGLVRIEK
jgi:ribosomal protein S12 methylthiotransferase accessory factor